MKVQIRPATQNDVTICGKIAYLAFKSIADQHNFPPDFPSVEDAVGVVSAMVASPRIYGIVAEAGGRGGTRQTAADHDDRVLPPIRGHTPSAPRYGLRRAGGLKQMPNAVFQQFDSPLQSAELSNPHYCDGQMQLK